MIRRWAEGRNPPVLQLNPSQLQGTTSSVLQLGGFDLED
jgi:hypothetical protein